MGAPPPRRGDDDSYTAADEDTDDPEIRGSLTRENVPLRHAEAQALAPGNDHGQRAARAGITTGNSVKPANYGRMHEEPACATTSWLLPRCKTRGARKALGDMLAFNAKVGAVLSVRGCSRRPTAARRSRSCATPRASCCRSTSPSRTRSPATRRRRRRFSYSDDADALEGATVPLGGSSSARPCSSATSCCSARRRASRGCSAAMAPSPTPTDRPRRSGGQRSRTLRVATRRRRRPRVACSSATATRERLSGGDLYLLNHSPLRAPAGQAERRPQLRARQRLPHPRGVAFLHGFVETMRTRSSSCSRLRTPRCTSSTMSRKTGRLGLPRDGRGTSSGGRREAAPTCGGKFARAPATLAPSARRRRRAPTRRAASSYASTSARGGVDHDGARAIGARGRGGARRGRRRPGADRVHLARAGERIYGRRFSAKIDGGDDGDGAAADAALLSSTRCSPSRVVREGRDAPPRRRAAPK